MARQKQRRAEDPEKARAAAREDYRRHKDRYQAYAIKYDRNALIRLWKKENKDLVAEYGRQRRARMYETEIERIETQVVADRDDWVCYLCDDDIDPNLTYPDFGYRTIDHVIPLSRNGTHTYDNIKIAHWICNIRKGASILGEDSKRTWVSREQDPYDESRSANNG